ncbi:MAG: glycoside hydrolase family 88 protein [Alistipes senegalensis]|nr:glycoside hydrolase family 88 protein [Bacteroides cellulosilyticus]MCM1351993.1 glycoside hydrolase family 88 protein [Alistipes senegalensis]
MKKSILLLALLASVVSAGAQKSWDLKHFPDGCRPDEIGVRLTERYLHTPHSHWGDIDPNRKVTLVTYPDVCAWLGALWFTTGTRNDSLYTKLVERFEPLFTTQKSLQPALFPRDHNVVDFYVFGAVPLEIYKRNRDPKYLELGMKYADGQWELPADPKHYRQLSEAKQYTDEGYSWQTRLWVDDMFMITDLQAQAYLVTGDRKYIDRAAREMALYLDRIQRPNGLFYHHTGTPYFWGRGDGWMAVGMAEMLRMLPKDCPELPRIREAYQRMMATLLRYQGYDGMWCQIIDNPNTWKESSSTAMFTYAMILGVKNGWLDKKIYGAAARKAWLALLTYLDENDNLRNVCEGTGAKNSFDWYQKRRRLTGDLHGQAAMLWCAYALSCDVKPYKL